MAHYATRLNRSTERRITERLGKILELRTDGPGPGYKGRLRSAVAEVRADMAREFGSDEIRGALEENRERVNAFAFDRYLSQVEAADIDEDRREELITLGRIDPPPELRREWDRENKALMASIVKEHLQGVVDVVVAAAATATAVTAVQAATRKRYGIVRRRARTIADDQSEKLAGRLDKARQVAAGLDRYRWRTMLDDRVRDEHAAREGQIFSWGSPPSDGHPGEPINCFTADTPVWSPSPIRKIIRGQYRGDLCLVALKDRTIRVTPNHPILTGRGLLRADQIEKTDYIMRVVVPEGAGSSEHHDQVTTFGEMWDLADVSKPRRSVCRELYGDPIVNGHVDVVDVDGGLVVNGEAPSLQDLEQETLSMSNELRSRSRFLSEFFVAHGSTSDGFVSRRRESLAFGGGSVGHPGQHGVGSGPNADAAFDEPSDYDGTRDPSLAAEGEDGLAVLVVAEQVVDVGRERDASCHVFTLETVCGWYAADSAIATNCRCNAEPVFE